MSIPFAAALALVSALPSLRAHPAWTPPAILQDADADPLRLLPDDAVLLVRLESVDALLELVNRFGAASGAPAFTASELLSDLNLSGDTEQVDSGRPLWFSMTLSQASVPAMTMVLPARDAQALAASLEASEQGKSVAAGGYVGFSSAADYTLAAEPSSLPSKLRPGLISLHLDLAELIEVYRPFIETGLDSAETMVDEFAPPTGGPDMAPVVEAYVDLAWDLVDSADQLDLALARNGPLLELQGSLSTLEGSPLAGWGSGPPIELPLWPAQIDPNATISMASAGNWAHIMQRMKPMTEVSLGMYPEGMRQLLRECLSASEAMYALMGPSFASFDFGPGGMRGGYIVNCEKPAELLGLVTALMGKMPSGEESLGISFSAPEPVTIDKLQAQRFHLEIDPAALARASMEQPLAEVDVEEFQQSMAQLWGEHGLDLTLATHSKSVAIAFGGDEAFVRSVLVERGEASSLPPELQRALSAVKGANTAAVYRFDLGRMFEQIGELERAMGVPSTGISEMPDSSLPLCAWGTVRGPVWSSGVAVDLDSLVAFVEAAAELQPSAADDPDLSQALVEMDLSMLGGALELYAAQHGKYPESLEPLVTPDAAGQTFIAELPVDPWDNAYVYEAPKAAGARFRLVCYGADGLPGGEGLNADIDYDSLRPGR
jgi:general secretion pathway protein G